LDNKAPIAKVYYDFKRYTSDGKEIPNKPVGIVSERDKYGSEITRGFNVDEKGLFNKN